MVWAYRARAAAERRGWLRTAGVVASVAATLRTRRPVRVRWDGADWEHRWPGGYLVTGEPTSSPATTVTYGLPIYYHSYTPRSGDIVVDCGAGSGVELSSLSHLVGPAGRVVAIEPDRVAFRRLVKAAARLRHPNAILVHSAVSDREGWAAFADMGHPNAINNHLVDVPVDPSGTVGRGVVPVRTLAEVCRDLPHIDLLLMNIEGEEARALASLGDAWPRVRHCVISCHDFLDRPGTRTRDEVIRLLVDAGMEIDPGPDCEAGSVVSYYVFASRQSR